MKKIRSNEDRRSARTIRVKKILCLLFVLVLLVPAFVSLAAEPAHAASLRNKKVVSVVYDDSGSMEGSAWAYANYAMQTFVAMLNEDDELYITYMSEPSKSVKIGTNDLLSAVKGIRNHSKSGSTPYKSLTTAMKQLESVNDTNPNTQYWFVVFTDGGFNDETNNAVANALDKFDSKKMANGSTPQIMYMTIGDVTDQFTPHPSSKDITVIRAQKAEDIRDTLFDIASRVSGRIRVDDKDIKLKKNTISLSSYVPLFNISILVQNKNISVVSIKDSDQHDIPIKYEIPVSMPDPAISGAIGINDMFGVVTLAGETQGCIAAGDYIITFSDEISKDDVVIMLEPALQLKIKLYIDGVEVTDLSDITVQTEGLTAEAAVYEYGTDNVILESLLPGTVSKEMTFSIDDKVIDSTDKLILKDLAVEEGENAVRASLDVAGFFHLETSVEFTPSLIPTIDRIDAELSYDGSPRRQRSDGSIDAENVVYVTDLKTNRTGIRFTVYIDGAPISRSMAKSLEKEFRKGLEVDFSNYEVEILSDGSYLVYPTKLPWYTLAEWFFKNHHGEQKVGVRLDNVYAEGILDFRMYSSVNAIVDRYVRIALILYAVWWILFKKHFPKCTLISAIGRRGNQNMIRYTESERVDLNWLGCFKETNIFSILINLILLILPLPSQTRFCGYTFTGQCSTVRKNYSLLVRNVSGKAVDTAIPRPHEISQVASVEMDETLFIRDGESYQKFYIEE